MDIRLSCGLLFIYKSDAEAPASVNLEKTGCFKEPTRFILTYLTITVNELFSNSFKFIYLFIYGFSDYAGFRLYTTCRETGKYIFVDKKRQREYNETDYSEGGEHCAENIFHMGSAAFTPSLFVIQLRGFPAISEERTLSLSKAVIDSYEFSGRTHHQRWCHQGRERSEG